MRAPEFWGGNGKGLLPLLLSPIAAIYACTTARRMARPGWQAPVPVICCGNATAGGAGKTTVTLDIGQRLANRGVAVHFLTRGYGGRLKGPVRVDPSVHDSQAVGDEALLLANERPTWVSADRAAGARAAVAAGAQAIVMDDGLQNPTLEKDLSLLVIDGSFGFGNNRVIPAGPLREPVAKAAARSRAAVMIGEDEAGAAALLPPRLPVLRAMLRPGPEAELLAGQPVYAFCGIANPKKFFSTLQEAGAVLAGKMAFADHYPFDEGDMRDLLAEADTLRAMPVTTRKDYVRIPPAFRSRVTVVTIRLEWSDTVAIEALLDPLAQRVPVPA
ncbi:tetraacyldisaccharide 4'-kinase [Siccirubricoccus deserti]|uniref:Tetraacyldisaccharide 4'-kinase n=1 Tax=Siccirubricoccus deserti TaxID=2013562 RepID=A0A9X0QVD0_9PROT|nr:tetraacyldisaccharide 4'-kinase [Siccirubricoccus deserti]MBC4014077.1 tetraacyldisaccharide 4'-kinase [Siccirubricoccus deserti]GGC26260.1 tetraacyldisaccharide 4'-kinase [Siccirubricoccus deserti]